MDVKPHTNSGNNSKEPAPKKDITLVICLSEKDIVPNDTVDNLKAYKCDPGKDLSKKADFETAIELTQYGKFHYILLAICGLVSTSEEMDVGDSVIS